MWVECRGNAYLTWVHLPELIPANLVRSSATNPDRRRESQTPEPAADKARAQRRSDIAWVQAFAQVLDKFTGPHNDSLALPHSVNEYGEQRRFCTERSALFIPRTAGAEILWCDGPSRPRSGIHRASQENLVCT